MRSRERCASMPEFNHVHIAALTGWGQDEDRRKAREAGCDSHFTKPLAPATLEQLLAATAERMVSDATPSASREPASRILATYCDYRIVTGWDGSSRAAVLIPPGCGMPARHILAFPHRTTPHSLAPVPIIRANYSR